jgi:secreted trypsin-like serine protease
VFKLVVAGVLASGAGNGLRYRRTGYLCLAALGLVILVVSSASAHPMKALWKLIPQLRREQVVPHLGHRAAPVRPAIINGTAATDGFRWLAFVAQTDGSTYFDSCTGSVVAPNWILTAGHCAEDDSTGAIYPAANFYVVTGSLDWTDQAVRQVSAVKEILPDPRYDPSTDFYDDALLLLSTPTTAPVLPLADGGDPSLYTPGSEVTLSGWGLTDPNDPSSIPAQLLWASTVLQPSRYCSARDPDPFASSLQTCVVDAPYYDNGGCFGDSGSPLIANNLAGQPGNPTEIGVLDTVLGSCATDSPDYFTRADAIAGWVNAEIAAVPPQSAATVPQTHSAALRMTASYAKDYTLQTLGGVFKRRYTHGNSHQTHCVRRSAVKFECDVNWSFGPKDYYGYVDAWYVLVHGQVEWTDHYNVASVSDYCYFHTKHPRRCKVSRQKGQY